MAINSIMVFAHLDVAIKARRYDVHDFFPKSIKIRELKAFIKDFCGRYDLAHGIIVRREFLIGAWQAQ